MNAAPTTFLMTVNDCPCGTQHRFTAKHYDVGRAQCGRFFWALQPKRNGAMKMFPWPGPNLTREEMKALQPSADKEAK